MECHHHKQRNMRLQESPPQNLWTHVHLDVHTKWDHGNKKHRQVALDAPKREFEQFRKSMDVLELVDTFTMTNDQKPRTSMH
jgi:hypothetical protein